MGSVGSQRRGRNTRRGPVISQEANTNPLGQLAKPLSYENRTSMTYNPTADAEFHGIKCSGKRIKARDVCESTKMTP